MLFLIASRPCPFRGAARTELEYTESNLIPSYLRSRWLELPACVGRRLAHGAHAAESSHSTCQDMRTRESMRGAYERHRVVLVPVQARPVRNLSPDERPSSRPLPHGVRGTAQRPRLRHGGTDAAHGAGPGRPDADLPAADRQGRGRGPSGARRAERGSPLRARSSRSVRGAHRIRHAPARPRSGPDRPCRPSSAGDPLSSALAGPASGLQGVPCHRQPGFTGATGACEAASLVPSSSNPLAGSIHIRSHPPPLCARRGRTRMTPARHPPPCSQQF